LEECSKTLNRWSIFKDFFSGSTRFVHACISDPFEPFRTIPSENEIIKVVYLHLLRARQSLFAIYEKQVELMDQSIRLMRSSDDGLDDVSRNRIKALDGDRIKAFDEWKKTSKMFFRLTQLDSRLNLKEQAAELANSGGVIGSIHDDTLGKKLPLLLGCFYLDELSVHEVQCLGVEPLDPDNNEWKALGCAVLDPLSGRIVSATLGGRMRDPRSGEIVPINGLLRDEDVNLVLPYSNLSGHRNAQPNQTFLHGLQAPEVLASLLNRIRTPEMNVSMRQPAESAVKAAKVDRVVTPTIQVFPAYNSTQQSAAASHTLTTGENGVPADSVENGSTLSTTRIVQFSPFTNPVDFSLKNFATGVPAADTQLTPSTDMAVSGSRRNSGVDGRVQQRTDLEKALESSLQQLFPGGGDDDVQGIFRKVVDDIRAKSIELQIKLEKKFNVLDIEHNGLVEKVKCSDLDVAHKEHLIAEMERQKILMDQIMAQEHSRQMRAFQRALFESAERRLRRVEKFQKQYNEQLHAAGGAKNLVASDHAAHRMQLDMMNALEDSVSLHLSSAAEQRLEEIAKEQEEVLEALAGCAGAANSVEMEDKILGQYEEDVDKIEARIRHTTAETISQLSADSEAELARKLARLKIAADRARAKKRWSKLRAIVKTGFLTASSRTLQTPRSVILARHEGQLEQLISSLDEQQRLEIMAMSDALDVKTGKTVSESEARLARDLKSANDDKSRALILDSHAADMDSLRKRMAIDKQQQLQALEASQRDRKQRKMEEWQFQAQIELNRATPESNEEFERQSQFVQVLVDKEAQRARLMGALMQQDRLEKDAFAHSLVVSAERQMSQSEIEFLTKLKNVGNDEVRLNLIEAHERECGALRKQLELDKNRQLEELQSKLETRRRRKLEEEQDKMHQQQLAFLLSPGQSREFEVISSEIEALTRQEHQKAGLESALNEASNADRQALAHSLSVARDLALAQEEVRFVENLNGQDSDGRASLIQSHEKEMELIKTKFELDKQRQLEELEQKISERRKHKINLEQAKLHQEEIALLRSGGNSQDLEVLGMKIELMLQHEVDAAQLSGAVIEHGIADLQILHSNQGAQQEAALAAANVRFLEIARQADDSERESLLKLHELDLAKLRAQGALTLSKAEDELQQRIADRKSKKETVLREKQGKSLQLLNRDTDKVSLMRELDAARSENTIEIEFEKKTASAMFNILSESESEVKLLREDFKEKAEQVILNAESKFAHELTMLQEATSDLDQERRNKLLQVESNYHF
jgi:hypothetical protein